MKRKFDPRHFGSSHSPAKIGYGSGYADIEADWLRSKNSDFFIDGKPLAKVLGPYITNTKENTFIKTEDLREFFKEHILHKIVDKNQLDAKVDFLMQHFHQGGILVPASGPLVTTGFKFDREPGCGIKHYDTVPDDNALGKLDRSQFLIIKKPTPNVYFYSLNDKKNILMTGEGVENRDTIIQNFNQKFSSDVEKLSMEQLIEIDGFTQGSNPQLGSYYSAVSAEMQRKRYVETTQDGFTMEEFYDINSLRVNDEYGYPSMDGDEEPLRGEDGKPIISGHAKLKIDFTQSASQPKLEIMSNMIHYGHSDVQAKLDKRSFFRMVFDFLKYYLYLNVAYEEQLKNINDNDQGNQNNPPYYQVNDDDHDDDDQDSLSSDTTDEDYGSVSPINRHSEGRRR